MSPRAAARRGHLSWRALIECEPPAGANRRIWLVGKRSTNSNRRILAATSFPTGWSPGFGLFHDVSSLPWLPLQGAYLVDLRLADETRSGAVCLPRNSSNTTTCQCSSKFFGCHNLPIAVRRRGLTGESPKRYIPVRRGRSRRGGLSKSPDGPVEGLSPGNCGERGLTECAARSTASNLRAQAWLVSRPLKPLDLLLSLAWRRSVARRIPRFVSDISLELFRQPGSVSYGAAT